MEEILAFTSVILSLDRTHVVGSLYASPRYEPTKRRRPEPRTRTWTWTGRFEADTDDDDDDDDNDDDVATEAAACWLAASSSGGIAFPQPV